MRLVLAFLVFFEGCGRIGYTPDGGSANGGLDAGYDSGVVSDGGSTELDSGSDGGSDAGPPDAGTDAWMPDACEDWDVALTVCTSPPDDPTLFERNHETDCVSTRRDPGEECYAEWYAYASCRGLAMRETCDLSEAYTRCSELFEAMQCCTWPGTCGRL